MNDFPKRLDDSAALVAKVADYGGVYRDFIAILSRLEALPEANF